MKVKGTTVWVTVVTNLGVIAGLFLVAYEVRQATLQAKAETSQAYASDLQVARKELALSSDLAEIYVKATSNGVDALTPVEKFRLTQWESARRVRILGQIRQYEMGFLERGTLEAMIPTLTQLEKGLWTDLGIGPLRGRFADVIDPIREEMGLRDP